MLNVNANYPININRINYNNNEPKTANAHSQKGVSFKAITYAAHPVIRTQMTSKDEQTKYNELCMVLDKSP